jgi:FMN-dependent NADH-azoreductase
MYNFAVSAAVKAWIDHVVRAGKTFRYTAAGTPEGLLAGKNKKVLAIIASGGSYVEGSGLTAVDHEVPYLRFIFGFMGITDLRFAQAGGTGAVAQGKVSAKEFLSSHLKEIAAVVTYWKNSTQTGRRWHAQDEKETGHVLQHIDVADP